MIIVKYSETDVFVLTSDEFKKALVEWNQGRSVFITRLGASLSPYYRWAGEKPDDLNVGYTHDGRKMIKRFGEWRFSDCPELIPDLNYYQEIAKDKLLSESEFFNKNKQISDKSYPQLTS